MTSVTADSPTVGHGEGHGHPSDITYWKVGLFLAAVTGLEVSTYWWPESARRVAGVALIIMMVVKFVTVAAYFMHLRFDALILRRVFVFGIVIALAVYIGTLTSSVYWWNSGVDPVVDVPRAKPVPPAPPEPAPVAPASGGGGH
ncbi:MAG: cytochrome C oxidase subunit IV family protein [Microthrixaceae bacterium]|nr:cytochrome C oxidase subunit IV family protein [Microthrixaceae bacterium]